MLLGHGEFFLLHLNYSEKIEVPLYNSAMWVKKVKACAPQDTGLVGRLFNKALRDNQPDIGTGADLTQFTRSRNS